MRLYIIKAVLIIGVVFFLIAQIDGQCSMTITSQEQIDNFTGTDPDDPLCYSFDGYLWSLSIDGPDITNLNGLSILDSCGRLSIKNTSLIDLSGLNNLTSVYRNSFFSGEPGIEISDNPFLENLDGIENISTTSNVILSNNAVLKNTDALNITLFKFFEGGLGWEEGNRIEVINNPMLESFTGLPGLNNASDVIIKDNPKLKDISALSNLELCYFREGLHNIDGSMTIENNDALTSLSILDEIVIARTFSIIGNDSLKNLSGLSLVTRDLIIEDNSLFTEFGDLSLNLKPDWKFKPSMQIINNDSLISIGVTEFIPPPEYLQNLSIVGNDSLRVCGEAYFCMLIENDAIMEVNVSDNDIGCNSAEELCDGYFNQPDFSINIIGGYDDCRNASYDIIVSNINKTPSSSSLMFISAESSNLELFSYTETDGAMISEDTLIWDDIFLDTLQSDTIHV